MECSTERRNGIWLARYRKSMRAAEQEWRAGSIYGRKKEKKKKLNGRIREWLKGEKASIVQYKKKDV